LQKITSIKNPIQSL